MFKHALFACVAFTVAAQAQTLKIASEESGQYPALPAPEWREAAGGMATADLRIVTGAAAMRLNFGGLFLPEGAEMVLYARNADGAVTAIHGPYTGSGPLNVPEFDSQLLSGAEVVVSVRAKASENWPFTLQGVEKFAPADLTGMELLPSFTPAPARKHPIDFRSAFIGDTLVHFNVEDGIAIMEGDMVLGSADEVISGARGKNSDRASFALTNAFANRWPNGVIPYNVSYSANLMAGGALDQKITAAVNYWNSRFPGVIVARTNQADFVTFRFVSGVCQSAVGHKGGQQFIDADNSCSSGNLIHEIGHALGLLHEHTRYDRNSFVKINTSNILASKLNNFNQPAAGDAVNMGAYDFGSIMHYSANAFAIDSSKPTITPLVAIPAGVTMGQRTALSTGDENGIRTRYCDSGFWSVPSSIHVDPDGETRTFSATIPPYCNWQVSDSANWITVNSAASGVGSTVIKFTAAQNNGPNRSGAIKLSGRTITIIQLKFNNQ